MIVLIFLFCRSFSLIYKVLVLSWPQTPNVFFICAIQKNPTKKKSNHKILVPFCTEAEDFWKVRKLVARAFINPPSIQRGSRFNSCTSGDRNVCKNCLLGQRSTHRWRATVVIQSEEAVIGSVWNPSHAADDSGAVKTRAGEGRLGVLHRRGAIHSVGKAVFSPPPCPSPSLPPPAPPGWGR